MFQLGGHFCNVSAVFHSKFVLKPNHMKMGWKSKVSASHEIPTVMPWRTPSELCGSVCGSVCRYCIPASKERQIAHHSQLKLIVVLNAARSLGSKQKNFGLLPEPCDSLVAVPRAQPRKAVIWSQIQVSTSLH